MVCEVRFYEKPELNSPVLIEGLPGIGFVANIAALHLIQQLKAKRFAEIHSSAFQDLAILTKEGEARFPINELYYYQGKRGERDLIIWYGNTQALTTFGQYELCGKVLDTAKELGGNFVITLGGYKRGEIVEKPKVYCAASDEETLQEALNLGAEIMVGQIFGVAGLLIGIGKFRNFKGLSLLVETPGFYPDAAAARIALSTVSKYLKIEVDLSKLDLAVEMTKSVLGSFGLLGPSKTKEEKEESQFRWFI